MDPTVLILLAEDEQLVASLVQDALEDGGFDVVVALTGEEAIAALERDASNLSGVVTDIRLGAGADGWEVARRARELVPTMPVIYMSGDSGHEHSSRGVPDSVMLQKPFAPAQLITAISTLMNAVTTRTTE